ENAPWKRACPNCDCKATLAMARLPNTRRPGSPMRAAVPPSVWADAAANRWPEPPSRPAATPARCQRLPPTERAAICALPTRALPICGRPICAALNPPPPRAPKLIPPRCPPNPPKWPPPPSPPPPRRPCPPPCPPPPPPRASASSVIRGTTRSSIAAMQTPVVNTGLTALRDSAHRTAAVGRALAYLHERRASNTDTGAFLRSAARRCLIYRNSASCQAVPAWPLKRPRMADLARPVNRAGGAGQGTQAVIGKHSHDLPIGLSHGPREESVVSFPPLHE